MKISLPTATFKRTLPWILTVLCIVSGQDRPSIHQLQLEYYNKQYTESPDMEMGPVVPKASRQFTPSKEVFGYHPYWMGGAWQNYNYNLLTTIAYFSAEITSTGGLSNLHGWPVTGLINKAHDKGVDVVLCATLFSNSALTTLLSSPTNRQNLIDNLLEQVQAGNADGVNIDFEVFPASQKQNMVQFITDLTQTFHEAIPGSQVTLAMPAVDWSNGWDYNALASISDGLFIMGYDYHYKGSSTTGANAPLTGGTYNITWTVNDYLSKSGNQSDKIILGCPYFGFEWPAASGQAGASTTGSGKALLYSAMESLAESFGKRWDSVSQTPWYRYENPGWFQGWYDDSASLALKYDFVLQKNLKGIGIWALGYDGTAPELWDALAEKFGATAAPTTPGDLVIQRTGQGSILIQFQGATTADQFIVLRGYPDRDDLDTLGIYSQRPILISGLDPVPYYLNISAVNSFGESPKTEMLGVIPSLDRSEVLIVNGFDRVNGTTNTFDFIKQHGESIHNRGYVFDSASNETIINGIVNLDDYTVVDWILGEEGTTTHAFSGTEQERISAYLDQGGQLFVSGSEIGYDLVAQGSGTDQQFYQEYLKARYISDAAGGHKGVYSVQGSNGSLFTGLNNITFDDGTHGSYDVDWPDGIQPVEGAQFCLSYTGVDPNTNGGAGIYFQGLFGDTARLGALVHLAVGFETLYPSVTRDTVMDRILTFFEEARASIVETNPLIPEAFGITHIYPNPSNSSVHIDFDISRQTNQSVSLFITDLLGRRLTSISIATSDYGKGSWTWTGLNSEGLLVPTGVYFAILEGSGEVSVRKFTIVK